ncbi:MAG: heavy-metal-associated domain-containing protein [Deltaproteobacteria bacterium]|nr:heavy-metal-associated domain-containing protein [Deltaproteobacteria bacterium]
MQTQRRRTVAALIAFLAFGLAELDSAAAQPTRTVRVAVKGLACMMCAGKIKKALLAEPGIEKVEASLPDQRFTLTVQGPGPDDARLRALVEQDGVVVVGILRD